MAKPKIDSILLSRLQEFNVPGDDPWGVGFIFEMIFQGTRKVPSPYSWHSHQALWTGEDHAARIRHIMQTPQELEYPIVLDCLRHGMHIYATPVLVDGCHRTFAHIALKRERIQASYSGRVDLLNYLTGKRKTQPKD